MSSRPVLVAADASAPTTAPATPGAVSEPPLLSGVSRLVSDASRVAFRFANRAAVVPLHQAGLAAWLGGPLGGWQCLVTTIGRRSGLRRHTPLGYIVMDGAAWVMAGYGPRTQWYRNILEEPSVELRLPGRRPFAALADEVRDPVLRARVIPPLCRSMALPGLMIGCVPATSVDERILGCVSWVPLVRIRPADGSSLAPGAEDPGGRGWIWRHVVMTGASAGLLILLKRMVRG
jgi:deazaflavin-dependent oxidoreductase (nitroreductase family)